IRYSTPNQIGSMPSHVTKRHEDRQRDEHHADLVHEHAEEHQQQHHKRDHCKRGQVLTDDGRDQTLSGARETQRLSTHAASSASSLAHRNRTTIEAKLLSRLRSGTSCWPTVAMTPTNQSPCSA